MKKTVFTFTSILFCSLTFLAQQPKYEWALNIGSSNSDYGYSTFVDDSGNTYATGAFYGTVDFDPDTSTFELSSNGNLNIYVTKYNLQGDLIWAKGLGGNYDDKGLSVTADLNGNCYVVGHFQNYMDIDPGSGNSFVTSNGAEDFFILKLDSLGNFDWGTALGSTGEDLASSVATDTSGNVLITGNFYHTVDFDPDTSTYNITSTGNSDVFILKLDSNGDFIWAKNVGGTNLDEGNCITVDDAANVYLTGQYKATPDFDPGPNVYTFPYEGGWNCFVLKLDSNGAFGWANVHSGSSDVIGEGIALDTLGNVFTTGHFKSNADFNGGTGVFNLVSNGQKDIFLSKISSTGDFMAAVHYGGSNYDAGYAVDVDSENNIYVTGYYYGMVDFNHGAGTFNLTPNGNSDAFVLKLNSNNTFCYAFTLGGGDPDMGWGVSVNASGILATTGNYEGMVDFDPGPWTSYITSSNYGSVDGYVLVLSHPDHPVPYFEVSSQYSNVGDAIQFTDQSINSPTSWLWDFGDGGFSTNQNPSHQYIAEGHYTIKLIVSNASGSDTLIMPNMIRILPPVPPLDWAVGFGGIYDDDGTSIAIDDNGNVFATGTFFSTVDFDPGPGLLNLTSNGSEDIYISKFDNAGNLLWAKSIGGAYSTDKSYAIETDQAGNVIVSGVFHGTVDFDPGPATNNITGSIDGFLLKLDANGNFIWVKIIGGNPMGHPNLHGMTLDGNDNIFLTGNFQGTVDFDPGTGTANLTSVGSSIGGQDIFVLKLDSLGNYEWVKHIGGNYNDNFGNSIAVDNDGNVITTGWYAGTLDFNPGMGVFELSSIGSDYDCYISKLSPSGYFMWAKSLGGYDDEFGYSVQTDSLGNVYVAGTFDSNVDFDPGPDTYYLTASWADPFVLKLDNMGHFVWAKQVGANNYDDCRGMALDNQANIYFTGNFAGHIDADPGPGDYQIYATGGGYDIYVIKMDSDGDLVWAENYGGSYSEKGIDIEIDNNGNIVTIGYFNDLVDFDNGPGTAYVGSNGQNDVFIFKLDPPEPIIAQFSTSDTLATILQTIAFYDETSGAPTSWLWDFGDSTTTTQQNPTHTYTQAGTYTVSLSATREFDTDTIIKSSLINITNNLVANASFTNATCFGYSDGAISLDLLNGTSPYTYSWSSGQNTQNLDTLQAGFYSVTINDANNIVFSDSFTIQEPLPIQLHDSVYQDQCTGTGGSIDLDIVGGTPPYLLSWSNGESTESIQNLTGGTYSLTISDTNACSLTDTFELIQPNSPFTLSWISSNISCNGLSDGSIDISLSGGMADTSIITWSNGSFQSSLDSISAGSYSVTVSQVNFPCMLTDIIEITEPDPLLTTITVTDVLCNGDNTGSGVPTISGGTSPYSLDWSNGSPAGELHFLEAGMYSLTVEDLHDCMDSISFTVTEPTLLTVTSTVTDVVGTGNSNGFIQTFPSGGTPPYLYNWNTGSSSPSLSNISAGTYSLTITDNNLCSWDSVFIVNETVGLRELQTNQNFTIYPNPTSEKLFVELPQSEPRKNGAGRDLESHSDLSLRIEILNTNGQVILQKEIGNESIVEVDVKGLVAGEYFVRMISGKDIISTKKFIKE